MDTVVRVRRGASGLESVARTWDQLAPTCSPRHVVHSLDWYRCFVNHLEPSPDELLHVEVHASDQPLAILPLRPDQHRLLGRRYRGLVVPNNPHVPFNDIVAPDPAQLRARFRDVMNGLAEEAGVPWSFLSVPKTLADSAAAQILGPNQRFRAAARVAGHIDVMPVRPYEEVFASLSTRFRNNLRRARRRAADLGDVVAHVATSPEDCHALFQDFLELEASGWKGTTGTGSAIALDDRLLGFYTDLLARYAARGDCQIHVLRHRQRPIAAAFNLIEGRTMYGLKIGFDESYSKIAPGNLLHEHLFQTCFEDPRIDTFNMASSASWHTQWRPEKTPLLDVFAFRQNLNGVVMSGEQAVFEQLRSMRRRASNGLPIVGQAGLRSAVMKRRAN